MKKTLGWLVDMVTGILYKHNSEIDLLSDNIPEDEYDAESLDIVSKLYNCDNVEEVNDVISNTLVDYFGKCAIERDQDYAGIAQEIWELWESLIEYNVDKDN